MTTKVDPFNSLHLGQETFFISNLTSEKNFLILFIYSSNKFNFQIHFFLFAGVAGIEPATPGFGDRCSTN